MAKALKQSGARIVATTEQAKALSSIAAILEVSDAGNSSIQDNSESADLKALLKDLSEARETARLSADDDSAEEVEENENENEDEEDWESPRMKAARSRKAKQDLDSIELLGKFVSLVDILPPLPKKGDFNVEAIKASQYFFS